MSRIRANQITNQSADGAPTVQHGLIIAGVSTFTGSVSIGGTLTYEDVTNIDSVGIVTARGGIHIDDSIVHIGDTNTKIRFPSADTVTAETAGSERLRIESGGTLFSKSPSDATPNFKFISDDTNWHGYLNQTVHGATISTILSCGGTWTVDGTTYNATKDFNGSFGTAALIVHNQYNSTATGGELVFVTKANGSSTTDGAVTERLRIHSTGQVTKPASCAFNVTHNGSQNYSSAGTHTITSWKTTDSRGFENTTTGGYFGSGIFTAPVTGAYFFTSTLLLKDIGGTNGVHVWWSKNDGVHSYWETRFNGNATGYGNYEPVSGQCTMYMSAGDTCRIKINFSGSSCGIHGDDQNWGNWGGFLIG